MTQIKIRLYCSRKLRRLNLGGNHLTKVPTQALRTLDMLKKLEMQENRISAIQEGDFEGTSTLISVFSTILQLRPRVPLAHHYCLKYRSNSLALLHFPRLVTFIKSSPCFSNVTRFIKQNFHSNSFFCFFLILSQCIMLQ